MRIKVNNSEVAHLWANKSQSKAIGNSFYFEGNTIYSYGSHFPIATHHNGAILFTYRSYSNSTAKHIGKTWQAIGYGADVIKCKNPEDAATGFHEGNINDFIRIILDLGKGLAAARKPEKWLNQIEEQKNLLNKYISFFGVKLTGSQEKDISFSTSEEYKERILIAAKEKKEQETKLMAMGANVHIQLIEKWKAGERSSEYDLPKDERTAVKFYRQNLSYKVPTYFRVTSNGEIESNLGIKLPVSVAKRYYDWYKKISASGGCKDCNYKILDYNVVEANEEILQVGCHNIYRSEIDWISSQLGW